MPSFAWPTSDFSASSATNPVPSWGFGSSTKEEAKFTSPPTAPAEPSSSSPFATSAVIPSPPAPSASPNHEEQEQQQNPTPQTPPSDLTFATVFTTEFGRQIARTIPNPSTILNGTIHTLRIYLSLSSLPPTYLSTLYTHFQTHSHNPLREIQLCVRSLLRPCLQDIYEDVRLREAVGEMVALWTVFGTRVRFFFWRPELEVQEGERDRFKWFVERDLVRAVEGLDEHDEVLSEILGEESCLFRKGDEKGKDGGGGGDGKEGLVDEMI